MRKNVITFKDVCWDYEASGFVNYKDPTREQVEGVSLQSYQKKISDKNGVMFFVNVHLYDMSILTKGRVGLKMELNVQFYTQDNRNGDYINITRLVDSPSDAINKAEEMWKLLKCGYYEKS